MDTIDRWMGRWMNGHYRQVDGWMDEWMDILDRWVYGGILYTEGWVG